MKRLSLAFAAFSLTATQAYAGAIIDETCKILHNRAALLDNLATDVANTARKKSLEVQAQYKDNSEIRAKLLEIMETSTNQIFSYQKELIDIERESMTYACPKAPTIEQFTRDEAILKAEREKFANEARFDR